MPITKFTKKKTPKGNVYVRGFCTKFTWDGYEIAVFAPSRAILKRAANYHFPSLTYQSKLVREYSVMKAKRVRS